jgi:hypothetical protein
MFAVIIVLCSLPLSLFFAQAENAMSNWSRTYEGDGYDALLPYSIIETSDGGYAMAVFVNSKWIAETPSWSMKEQYELRLIKLGSDGAKQWSHTYGTGYRFYFSGEYVEGSIVMDRPYTVVQTKDDGYAIGGNAAGNDWWLIKTDSFGRMLWNRTFTYPASEYDDFDFAYRMIQTSDAGFVFAGSATVYSNGGSKDYCLLKVDSGGNLQWTKVYNSGTYKDGSGDEYNRDDEAYDVIQTRDGGYAIAGQSKGYGTTDFWLVKTDSKGKETWNMKYEEPYVGNHFLEVTHRVVQTSDGGYALAGSLEKSAGDMYGDNDFYLTKVDASGNFQWRKTYGEEYVDVPCSLFQLSDGGFVLGGTMTEAGIAGPISKDFGLVRTDSAGNLLWMRRFNGDYNSSCDTYSYDFAYAMTLTFKGEYVIAGTINRAWDGSHVDALVVKTESLETPFPAVQPLSLGEVSGSLDLQELGQGSWNPASAGDMLETGAKLKTSENAGGSFTFGGTRFDLNADTLVVVLSSAGDGRRLQLVHGRFSARVENLSEGETLTIEMSQAVATVKGTVFTLDESDNESLLSVQEGVVTFVSKTTGETLNLSEGQSAMATSAGFGEITRETGLPSFILVAIAAVVVVLGIILSVLVLRKKKKGSYDSYSFFFSSPLRIPPFL